LTTIYGCGYYPVQVKRNMELELEAVHALQNKGTPIIEPTTAEEEEEQLQRWGYRHFGDIGKPSLMNIFSPFLWVISNGCLPPGH